MTDRLDSMYVVNALADTLNKAKEPLTENQLMMLHGGMAIWFDKIQEQAAKQDTLSEHKVVRKLLTALRSCRNALEHRDPNAYEIRQADEAMLSALPEPPKE